MGSPTHLSTEMRAVLDATRGALDDAQRRIDRASHLKAAIAAMAAAALRQRDLTDDVIAGLLDIDPDTLGATRCDPQDWEMRAEIERVWTAVCRHGSVWLQDQNVTTSAQVVDRNRIDAGAWPLAVRTLDTPGAEFTHQTSGEKIVVYSLQGRNGTPTIVDDAIDSWDHRGEYQAEFVSDAGIRNPLNLTMFGVLPATKMFRRRNDRDTLLERTFAASAGNTAGRDADETFDLIVAAVRRMYGPLPPFRDAAAALAGDPADH